MPTKLTRRRLLRTSAALGAGAMLAGAHRASASTNFKVDEVKVISHQPHLYNGWPTLARRLNGELLLVCSGGRESHVCPFGRVELMRSRDGGRTWSWPRVVIDGAIDDRDAGVLETSRGTILVTTFTSSAWENVLKKAETLGAGGSGAWPAEKLARWRAVRARASEKERTGLLAQEIIRSTDGGLTWSAPYSSIANSPHGPVQLADGRLLYAGVTLWDEPRKVGVCESKDDGITWQWLADIPTRSGDNADDYHELHAVEVTADHVIVHIRNHNKTSARETLQTESTDGGRTWSVPRTIGVWGLPSHLLRLKDGRLLMSYGHRRPPFGNQARVSADAGKTWSDPMILSGDGAGGDLGYPSTVELDDGSLVTVWYEKMRGSTHAVLRQARWSI